MLPGLLKLNKSDIVISAISHSELEYEGSCAIDSVLLEAANIREYEQIQIYNLGNGERFTTYAISAEAHSGIISVNGAAAHKASPGDRVIICTYAVLAQQEANAFRPTLIYLDENNHIKDTRNAIPVQVA